MARTRSPRTPELQHPCWFDPEEILPTIHNAYEITHHPTGSPDIALTVVFPNALWLCYDPVLLHFREPTQLLFLLLERPFYVHGSAKSSQDAVHLQFIDKYSLVLE